MKLPLVLHALLLALPLAASVEAQAPRRIPLTGYVDRSGSLIEPAVWETGSTLFKGDWVAVSRKGKSGYLNLRTRATTGLIFDGVADARYDHALFSHGPEPVKVGTLWGYADEKGQIVIEPRFASYASSKGALMVAAQSLARELGADKIRVNSVVPGYIWGKSLEGYFKSLAKQQGTTAEQVYDAIASRTALHHITEPLEKKPWGLMQFTVEDLDGNRFYFHCD